MKKITAVFLSVILLFGPVFQVKASDELYVLAEKTGNYIKETVKNPIVGSIGGEWAVIGLARSGMDIPEDYFSNYYNTVNS